MTKREILDLLWYEPVKIGHWVGFKDLTELHNQWLRDFLYLEKDQTKQAHRGSYKTTTLSLALALIPIIYPNLRSQFFRKTDTDVKEVITQSENILKSGCIRQMVRVLYGVELNLTTETATEFSTNLSNSIKGSNQVVGLGIGTSITGKHADIIVTDDIINIKDRVSRAERERTKLAYQELQNIKNRGGRFINTGTPWHKDDAFTLMPNIEVYDCYSTNLITKAEIESLKKSMTSSLFAANYEMKHIAGDDVLFTSPQINANDYLVEQGIAHIDAAYNGEDYTAFTIVCRSGKQYYVFGKMWRKHVDDCLADIIRYHRLYNAGKVYVENNGDKGYLAKDLKRLGLRVSPYHESTNKFLKISTYLKGEWENVIFVNGTDQEYIDQITDYNEDAEHDDAPDSLASLIRKLWKKRDD